MFLKNPKEKGTIEGTMIPPGRPRRRSSSVSIYKSSDRVTSPVARQRRRSSSISLQTKLSVDGISSPGFRRRSSSMSLQDLTRNVHNLEQLQMLHAVYQDDVDQMSELLQSGSDPNLVGSEGSPLLHVAVESGNEEMVQVLLSCDRCKVNIEDVFGQTPLMKATIFDDVPIMKILHKAGAKLDSTDQTGRTALLASLQDNKSQAARFLIKSGCDVNIVDDFGQSALYLTINNRQSNCVRIVERLMKAGYTLEKDKGWMDEEGFDVKIIHTKGILRRLLAKFRSRMNTIKCDNSKTNGLHRRILTIYS